MKTEMKRLREKVDIVASALEASIKSRDIQCHVSECFITRLTMIKVLQVYKALLLQENENTANMKLANAIQVLTESCRVSECSL